MNPKVSVSLITFQHAPFIAQAIEGVLAQRTNFPFELVIGEDDSSDGTREIVRSYAEQNPDIIRAHYHSRVTNISYGGKATGRHNFVHNLRSARGAYIALLDGDDYFSDPEKLQRQVDFLDAHAECGTCFHRVSTIDGQGAPIPVGEAETLPPRLTVEDLLRHRFSAPTASVMFRRGLFPDFPEWYFRCPVGDFPLHVLNGQAGDFGFLDREMAAYRVHAGGRWSALADYAPSEQEQQQNYERKLRQLDAVLHLYEILATVGLPPRQIRALRLGKAAFHLQAARLLKARKDYPAMRARLRAMLRAVPASLTAGWFPAARLLLEAAAPLALCRATAAWRERRAA